MKVEVKEVEPLVRELSVEVPAETVNSKIEEKLDEVRREATLKGFRKGKAPLNTIRSLYHDQVKIDVAEELVKSTYPQVIREKTLRVASYPTVTSLDYNEDGSLKYTATVEVFPEIERVNFDNLELSSKDVESKDEEVDDIIGFLRKRHSEVRVVEREAKEGDTLVLDIHKTFDPGNVLDRDQFIDSEVDLGNKLTVPAFKEHLPGMKAGDEKEIEVKYAADYPDQAFAGAHLKYNCKVKSVKERLLPELNDQFAKQTGQAETLLELRMKIREQLKAQKQDDQNRDTKAQIVTQICDKNPIPVPKGMIKEYLDNVVEDFKKQYQDVDEAEVRKNYEAIGINTIRWNMLLHQLAKQENVEVLPSDTENLINRFAQNYKMSFEQAKEALQKSGNIADVRESILEDKVIDFLVTKAKVVNKS